MVVIKDERFYTQKEVAKLFGVTTATIANWRKRHGRRKLEAYFLNARKILYSETSIQRFILNGKR